MLVCLLSIVSFQPVLRTAPATGRVARTAISMQLPDFGKSLQGMMPGGGGDDSGLSKEQAEEMEARMKTGGMTFDDFLMQTKVMQKAGAPLAVESGLHHAGCAWAAPHFPSGTPMRGLPAATGHGFHGCMAWRESHLSARELALTVAPCGRQHAAHDAEHAAASRPHLLTHVVADSDTYGCRQHAGHDEEDALRRRRRDLGRAAQGRRAEAQALRRIRGAHVSAAG